MGWFKRNKITTAIIMFGVLLYTLIYYLNDIIYYYYGPKHYIAFDLDSKRLESMDKYGSNKILLEDNDIIDCSNGVEVDDNLIFITNCYSGCYLQVLDLKNNTIVSKIPLLGSRRVNRDNIYLLGNELLIKYRTSFLIRNENFVGENQYELQYYAAIQDVLNKKLKFIKPNNYEDFQKKDFSHPAEDLKYYNLFYDSVYIETLANGKDYLLYKHNGKTITYNTINKQVYLEWYIGSAYQGFYYLNNDLVKLRIVDYRGYDVVYRFKGMYKEFILFDSYNQYEDLKHGKTFKYNGYLVYCPGNRIFKRIHLPKKQFNNKQILYIGD